MTSRLVIGLLFSFFVLAAVPAPAAAHDHECTVAMHFSFVKVHQGCDNKYKGDTTECFLSYNAFFLHDDILC